MTCFNGNEAKNFFQQKKLSKNKSHEMIIFGLKMMVKSGLEFLFWNSYLLTCQANSAGLIFFCTGQQQLWRGSLNFKIKILDHFSSSFLSQNCWFQDLRFYSIYSTSSRWCDLVLTYLIATVQKKAIWHLPKLVFWSI